MSELAEVHELPQAKENGQKITIPRISEGTVNHLFQEYRPPADPVSKRQDKSLFSRLRYTFSSKDTRDKKDILQYAKDKYIPAMTRMNENLSKLQEKYPSLYGKISHFLDTMPFTDVIDGNPKESKEIAVKITKGNILSGFGTVLLAYEAQDPTLLRRLADVNIQNEPDTIFSTNLDNDRQYPDTFSSPDNNLNTIVNRLLGLPDENNGARAAYEYIQYRATSADLDTTTLPLAA